MSSPIQISDDDDSFSPQEIPDAKDFESDSDTIILTSDDELDYQLPPVDLKAKKSEVIKKLFPNSVRRGSNKENAPKVEPVKRFTGPEVKKFTGESSKVPVSAPSYYVPVPHEVKKPVVEMAIGGVKVQLPVKPYGSQIALMAKMMTAMKERKNCLLESPTGSGKTLALLCGALAWQAQERNRIAQSRVQDYFCQQPELNDVTGAAEYISSPRKDTTPMKLFDKKVFGQKSIYDKPDADASSDHASWKRPEPMDCDDSSDTFDLQKFKYSPRKNEVTIHKRRRVGEPSVGDAVGECSKGWTESPTYTPEKTPGAVDTTPTTTPRMTPTKAIDVTPEKEQDTPQMNLPIIYYGARTHKQLKQVIKEFGRTTYCGETKMTLLASREYSCIREFDKNVFGSKNDMCRECTKKVRPPKDLPVPKIKTNCEYFDNRQALHHGKLPPAFDLDDIEAIGREIKACPFYATRLMMQVANIVFCPYNYLIEPTIRSSMQIELQNNVVIIDEAHNIEDICRDAATFAFMQSHFRDSIKELEVITQYRHDTNTKDIMPYLDYLLQTFRTWDQWFHHQKPLLANKPVNNNECEYVWEVEHFVDSLKNHNIGQNDYPGFSKAADEFCLRFREQPDTLRGLTQSTASLAENLSTVLGYLFRYDGAYKHDFKPALIRNVYGNSDLFDSKVWRGSQFDKKVERETLTLRLVCLNSSVIFEGLKTARCIMLASGTLTPLHSLHSELATDFPLQVSPNHVIPADRVWIGTLTTCPDGTPLQCTSKGTDQPVLQDAIGDAVHWVCQVTPNGVLVFVPSYMLMNKLFRRWEDTGLWRKLNDIKNVFMESRKVRDHNEIMDSYYETAASDKGALLFAVYRGKVSEGMDFKDHQARAVITVGIPYPNTFDMGVKEKMKYNDRFEKTKNLLPSREWLRVQAYRALNQAVGRCVRHRGDWGAVLLLDSRFANGYYTEHLSKWVKNFLGNNHHTFESLINSPNSLESFMQNMAIQEEFAHND